MRYKIKNNVGNDINLLIYNTGFSWAIKSGEAYFHIIVSFYKIGHIMASGSDIYCSPAGTSNITTTQSGTVSTSQNTNVILNGFTLLFVSKTFDLLLSESMDSFRLTLLRSTEKSSLLGGGAI